MNFSLVPAILAIATVQASRTVSHPLKKTLSAYLDCIKKYSAGDGRNPQDDDIQVWAWLRYHEYRIEEGVRGPNKNVMPGNELLVQKREELERTSNINIINHGEINKALETFHEAVRCYRDAMKREHKDLKRGSNLDKYRCLTRDPTLKWFPPCYHEFPEGFMYKKCGGTYCLPVEVPGHDLPWQFQCDICGSQNYTKSWDDLHVDVTKAFAFILDDIRILKESSTVKTLPTINENQAWAKALMKRLHDEFEPPIDTPLETDDDNIDDDDFIPQKVIKSREDTSAKPTPKCHTPPTRGKHTDDSFNAPADTTSIHDTLSMASRFDDDDSMPQMVTKRREVTSPKLPKAQTPLIPTVNKQTTPVSASQKSANVEYSVPTVPKTPVYKTLSQWYTEPLDTVRIADEVSRSPSHKHWKKCEDDKLPLLPQPDSLNSSLESQTET